MSGEEDQKLMKQISLLAGQINRHKTQQAGTASMSAPYSSFTGHGRGAGPYRGQTSHPFPTRGGYRVGKPPVHRNRTLVLNGTSAQAKIETDSGANSDASTSSWVTKNDRHRQLINSSVYEEKSLARAKAIEQTRLERQRRDNHKERMQLLSHFDRMPNAAIVSTNPGSASNYEVVIDGIRFQVTKGGSKLVKLPGDAHSPHATPKTAFIGGVKFLRSKNGNLYRQGIVKAQRRATGVTKVNVPCKIFSTTGSCSKGPMCRYVHDPSKVAACKDFLLKGDCIYGDSCDLSHQLIPERTPHCVHYAKGNCSKSNCSYTHRVLPPGAQVCRSFGFYGYCEKGISCPDRHAFECPDFSNTGFCKNKGCKLLHRERASVLRKANAAHQQASTDDAEDDISSDDDGDSVDDNDIDSDEVEDFIGEEDSTDFDDQKDYIQF